MGYHDSDELAYLEREVNWIDYESGDDYGDWIICVACGSEVCNGECVMPPLRSYGTDYDSAMELRADDAATDTMIACGADIPY